MGTVIQGHVLEVLASLEAESVSCVVTSPPYWSLRKYDAPDVVWGGVPGCEHEWAEVDVDGEGYTGTARWQHTENGRGEEQPATKRLRDPVTRDVRPEAWSTSLGSHGTCTRCGAWRGQYGLEPTPELYIEHTLEVLRGIRRVLRPDGVVWWNIGDGYAGSWGNYGARDSEQRIVRKERYPRDAWEEHQGRPPSAAKPSLEVEGASSVGALDIAWAAGFFDGEGNVNIRTNPNWQLVITASQVDRVPIDRLAGLFGGRIGQARSKKARWRDYWTWTLLADKASNVLSAMLPQLTTKRRQAEIALEFQATVQTTGRRLAVSPEDKAHREALVAALRAANHGEEEPVEVAPKNLVLMPFRVALAAQADGWYVRSVIIWSKPNAMPESTKDRPTTAHEYLLMLTRSPRYWYDQEAVREAIKDSTKERSRYGWNGHMEFEPDGREIRSQPDPVDEMGERWAPPGGRNLRSVWEFPTAQTPEAHFATFPEELPRRCIEASCPREICAKCGTARVRVVESGGARPRQDNPNPVRPYGAESGDTNGMGATTLHMERDRTTIGWTSCDCADYQPGLVLDPFCGIGTTGVVAKRLGRRFVGIELSEKYAAMARDKLRLWWRKSDLAETAAPEGQAVLPLEAP